MARHVLVFDTDSPPLLPLRCHLLFDDEERPLWALQLVVRAARPL